MTLNASIIFVIFIVLVLVLYYFPIWQTKSEVEATKRLELTNEYRRTLVHFVGGFTLLLGAVFAYEDSELNKANTEKSQQQWQDRLLADSFGQAVDQLGARDSTGKPLTEIRLGGIYTLERIAQSSKIEPEFSNKYYLSQILDILSAYIRHNAQLINNNGITIDVNAALSVISTLKNTHPINLSNTIFKGLQLSDANLQRTNLQDANFENVILLNANLTEANLSGAKFTSSNLGGATMDGVYTKQPADFSGANLVSVSAKKATLDQSNLSYANLSKGDFRGTYFSGAKLIGTKLRSSDLRGAMFFDADLTDADLSGAILTESNIEQAASLLRTNLSTAKGLTKKQKADCKQKGAIVIN